MTNNKSAMDISKKVVRFVENDSPEYEDDSKKTTISKSKF